MVSITNHTIEAKNILALLTNVFFTGSCPGLCPQAHVRLDIKLENKWAVAVRLTASVVLDGIQYDGADDNGNKGKGTKATYRAE